MFVRVSIAVISLVALAFSTPAEVPAAVAEWFTNDAVATVISDSAGDPSVDYSHATHTGAPVAIIAWTTDFSEGKAYGSAFEATGSWVASIHSAADVLGTVSGHYAQANTTVEFVGYDNDAGLGEALDALGPDTSVIFDGLSGTWVALSGETVRPLNAASRELIGDHARLDAFQKTIAAEHSGATDRGFDAKSFVLPLGVALVVVIAAALVVALALRRRNSTPRP